MKFKFLALFAAALLTLSCNSNSNDELNDLLIEIASKEKFEKTKFEFTGDISTENENSSMVKITFESLNSDYLDYEKFAKKTAKKVANLNDEISNYKNILIEIIDYEGLESKEIPLNSDQSMNLELKTKKKSFIFKSKDLKN